MSVCFINMKIVENNDTVKKHLFYILGNKFVSLKLHNARQK